jgi:hypothetical protein
MESLRATAEGMQHFKALSFKLETEKKQLQLQLDDQSDALSEKVQVKSCYLNMLYIQLSVFLFSIDINLFCYSIVRLSLVALESCRSSYQRNNMSVKYFYRTSEHYREI